MESTNPTSNHYLTHLMFPLSLSYVEDLDPDDLSNIFDTLNDRMELFKKRKIQHSIRCEERATVTGKKKGGGKNKDKEDVQHEGFDGYMSRHDRTEGDRMIREYEKV